MTDNEMTSVVNRAWKVLPLASQALRDGDCHSHNWYVMEDIGRRLIPLGSDCRSYGLTNLGLTTENLGRVFLEIGSQKLMPSPEHVTLMLNALDEISELFVELEATSQVSRTDLTATQNHLQTLLSSLRPNRNCDNEIAFAAVRRPTDPIEELCRCGDTLAVASESLCKRILADETSPYSASISGIHHLAIRLRDGLHELGHAHNRQSGAADIPPRIETLPLVDETRGDTSGVAGKSDLIRQIVDPVEGQAEEETRCEIASTSTVSALPEKCDRQSHSRVVVATESPFVRMLLQTAIHSLGVEVHSVSCGELFSESRELRERADILVLDRTDSSDVTAFLNGWNGDRRIGATPVTIGLCSNESSTASLSNLFDYTLPRSNLTDLLNLIRSLVGIETTSVKLSA